MDFDRKTFLRFTGLSLAAVVTKKAAGVLAATHTNETVSGTQVPRRLAMVVDSRKCLEKEGCDVCIKACHRSHNVPAIGDERHEVKWVWKEPFKEAFVSEASEYANASFQDKPFIVLCNHCDQPACVRVCPTQATWKREDGIVMMDWHRCIGCRYCMAACPYGARSFNWVDPRPFIRDLNSAFPTRTKGVVEKCTFCPERLAEGKLPVCVEACPQKALAFGDLEDPDSAPRRWLRPKFAIRRKPELGTAPQIYYIV